jgi:N6-L-threonylcarbamoyladenine synthase
MIILGIETSCDETAAALIKGDGERVVVLSNIVSSQVELHAPWGGVVPNLAAREHLKNILPVISQTIREANMKPQDIDLITVTAGPGLIPALLIGVNTAKTLAYVWKKPLMGIHHIEGHIYANFVSGGGEGAPK